MQYALISTLQKSGTWYLLYALWVYKRVIKTPWYRRINLLDSQKFSAQQESKEFVGNKYNFQDLTLFVGHAICPGIKDLDSQVVDEWNKLSFWTQGYNWTEKDLLKNNFEQLKPNLNPDSRIVYVHRNPIDHFVSFYKHCKNHKFPDHKPIADMSLHDFVFKKSALEAYIKHISSFEIMHKYFPHNILLVHYEDLVSKPHNTFYKIFKFLGIAEFQNKKFSYKNKRNISRVVRITSKNKIKKLEKRMGRSIANDQ